MALEILRRKKQGPVAEESDGGEDDEDDPNIQWSPIGRLAYLPFLWIPAGKLRSTDRVRLHWSRFTWMVVLTLCHFITIVPLSSYNDDFTMGGATDAIFSELFPPQAELIERVAGAEISPEFSTRMHMGDVGKLMTRLQMFCMNNRGVDNSIPWAWSCEQVKVTIKDATHPIIYDVIHNARLFNTTSKDANASKHVLQKMCQESFFLEHVIRGDDPRQVPWGDMAAFSNVTGLPINAAFDPYTEHEAFELSEWISKRVMHDTEASRPGSLTQEDSVAQRKESFFETPIKSSSVNSTTQRRGWMEAVVQAHNENVNSANHGVVYQAEVVETRDITVSESIKQPEKDREVRKQKRNSQQDIDLEVGSHGNFHLSDDRPMRTALSSSNDKDRIIVHNSCPDAANQNGRIRKAPRRNASSVYSVAKSASSIHSLSTNPSDRSDDVKDGSVQHNGDAISKSTLEQTARSTKPPRGGAGQEPSGFPLSLEVVGPNGAYQLPIWCFEGNPIDIMGFRLREYNIQPDGPAVEENHAKRMFRQSLKLSPQQIDPIWKKLTSFKKDGTFGWIELMRLAEEKEFVSVVSKTPSEQWYVKRVCRNHHFPLASLCNPREMSIELIVELSSRQVSPEPSLDYSLRRSSLQVVATFTQMDKDYEEKYTPGTGWYHSYLQISRRKMLGGKAWTKMVSGLCTLLLCTLLLFSELLWTAIRLPYSLYDLLAPHRRQKVTNFSEALERTYRLYDGRGVRSHFLTPLQILMEAMAVILFIAACAYSSRAALTASVPPIEGMKFPSEDCRKQYAEHYVRFHMTRVHEGLNAAQDKLEADLLASPYQVLLHCSGDQGKLAMFRDLFLHMFYSERDVHAVAHFFFCVRCLNFISAFHGTVWIGQTLEHCMSKLMWFFLVYASIVLIFASLLHVAYGIFFLQFSTFPKALYTLVMFSVGYGDSAFEGLHMWEMNASFYAAMFLSLYAFAMVAVFMQFFITIILDVYSQLTADDGEIFRRKQISEDLLFQEGLYEEWYPNMHKNPLVFRDVFNKRAQSYNVGLLWKAERESDEVAIVITGGAVRDVDYLVLCSFILQLFHLSVPDIGLRWPSKVILLGEPDDADGLKDLVSSLELDGILRKRIEIKNRSPLSQRGLEKAKVAKAKLVYILPSMNNEDLDGEDQFNISIALSVKGMTKTPFRLMLMRPSSKTLAMTCGISPTRCCAINLMKTTVLAQNVRVQGWSAILATVCQNISMDSKALEYAKQVQFPEAYLNGLNNRIWGFSLKEELAGKPFHEVAGKVYHECGALAFCAQIAGHVEVFPAKQILEPCTVIFCIAETDPNVSAPGLVAPGLDWKDYFFNQRMAAAMSQHDSQVETLMSFSPGDERASAQDMQAMANKVKKFRQNDLCALTAMTSTGKVWQQVHALANIFGAARINKSKAPLKLIILVAELPPQRLVDDLRAADENSDIAFIEGNPQLQTDLIAAGATDCDIFLTFPTEAPSWDASADTNTFFLLRTLQKLEIDPKVNIVIELSSGKAGAHMLPPLHTMFSSVKDLSDFPAEPDDIAEHFSLWFAAGQAFTPQSIIMMFANTFYCFGLLEVVQALTVNCSKMDFQPEQVLVPSECHGCEYRDFVVKCLAGAVGPGPVVPVGLLREAKWAKVTVTHPSGSTKLESTDLVIILADQSWLDWALSQSLVCVAGLELGVRRSSEHHVGTVSK